MEIIGPTDLGSPTIWRVQFCRSGTELVGLTKGGGVSKYKELHKIKPWVIVKRKGNTFFVEASKERKRMGNNYLQHQQFSSVERKKL